MFSPSILGTYSHWSSMPMLAFDWQGMVPHYCARITLDLSGITGKL